MCSRISSGGKRDEGAAGGRNSCDPKQINKHRNNCGTTKNIGTEMWVDSGNRGGSRSNGERYI